MLALRKSRQRWSHLRLCRARVAAGPSPRTKRRADLERCLAIFHPAAGPLQCCGRITKHSDITQDRLNKCPRERTMLQRIALRQWGARLAFLAVCVQFVLSYGHMHADALFGSLGHSATSLTQLSVRTHSIPGNSGLAGVTEDACAICASIALLGSTSLPDPIRLPPPPIGAAIPIQASADLALGLARFTLFQTRAPPAI